MSGRGSQHRIRHGKNSRIARKIESKILFPEKDDGSIKPPRPNQPTIRVFRRADRSGR